MKKIIMMALVSTLAVGAFANVDKPKKHKHSQQCTQQKCTHDCKPNSGCNQACCNKA